MKTTHGFTLVEMLVSMILLSMVILIGSTAYSQLSQRWDGRLGHFNQSAAQAKNLILVQETLDSIIPYVVTDEKNIARMYFEGNRNGFVAVSLRSVYHPEMAAVVRLQIVQDADFSYSLVYQEATMSEKLLTKAQQALDFNKQIVLFTGLQEIEFNYYGWPSIDDKNWSLDSIAEKQRPAKWSNAYNSLDTQLHPEAINVTFSNAQGQYSLQTKSIDTPNGILSWLGEQHDL